MGVRRNAGLHAKEINRMKNLISISNIFKNVQTDDDIKSDEKKLQEYLGHTPLEVVGGAIVGIIIGLIVPVK